jgi:hypothetical protein
VDAAALESAWASLDADESFPTEEMALHEVVSRSEGELIVSVESLLLDDVLPHVEEKVVLSFADTCLGCAFSRLILMPVRFPDGEVIPSRAMLISGELEAVAVVEVVGRRSRQTCVECGDSLAAFVPTEAAAPARPVIVVPAAV